MNEELKKIEEERSRVQKKIKNVLMVTIPIAIILVIIGFVTKKALPVFVIIAVVIVAVPLLPITSEKNKMKKSFKTNVVKKIIEDTIEDAVYMPESGVSLETFLETKMVKRPDRYHSEDFISGVYNNVKFISSDVKLEERHTTTDSNGHTTTTYETYFKGKFVRIDLIRDLPLVVQVIEKQFLNFKITRLEKVETESIEFNKKFKTYATSEQDAFYVLTPQIQEKLLELERKFPGTIQYSFQNGYLYTYINSSQDEFEINFSKPIDEKLISRIKTEATLPCMIINEFRLDQDKWTNKDR